MIDAHEAIQIASDARGEPVAGIGLADDGYVVGFHGRDPFANLPMFVDAHTGEARTLGAGEYVKIMDTLRPVFLDD